MKSSVIAFTLLALLALLALVGCASSGIQQAGRDTYTVSVRAPFSGPVRAKGDALKQANAFCAKRSKQIELVSQKSNECMLHGGCGEAEIIFMCLDATDPRYGKSPEH